MLQRVRAQTLQRHGPGWVARFAGANDTPRYGSAASKPLVTGTETARNLTEIRSQAAAAGARVIWMTPTACDTARVAAHPPFQGQQMRRELSDPADLAAVDAMVIEHQQVPPALAGVDAALTAPSSTFRRSCRITWRTKNARCFPSLSST
jgi:lysophospholipase L1-like esterase